jgi:hypothetical protein
MYQVFVLLHVVGVVVFAAAHGVSMFAAFQVRRETDPRTMASILGTSKRAVAVLYLGLLLLAVGGFGAATIGGVLLAPWMVASYVVLVAVGIVMGAVGTPYYVRLRELLATDGPNAPDAETLRLTLDTRRPEILLVVGSAGMLVLLWLMVIKPS